MEEKAFSHFLADQAAQKRRVEAVGWLRLSRDAGRKEYVLASIAVINQLQPEGGDQTVTELELALEDVVNYRLWDADHIEGNPPIIRSTAGLSKEISHTLAHLATNGLIDEEMLVTPLGHELLESVGYTPVFSPPGERPSLN